MVRFLEQVGFQRIILARELNLDKIAEIRRSTSVDLECFVHWALPAFSQGYEPFGRHGASAIEPAAESGLDMHGKKVMTTRYCILREIGRCGERTP